MIMKYLTKITTCITLITFLMLSCFFIASARNRKYNPFYYPELSKYADSRQINFSTEYKAWLTPDSSQTFKDITNELLADNYTFERSLFNSEQFIYEGMDGRSLYYKETVFNGVLGDKYDRIEIYINPQVERTDSLTFKVTGKSKVKKNICDFTGEIHVEHIYNVWERANDPDSPDYYLMVCNYLFKEDEEQYGTGFFKGTYGVYCYIDEANKKVCLDIDLGGGDGYNKRNYVGTWQSYKTKAVKRCIWGQCRLPYTFDFDIGDENMRINPKYNSPEWEQWQSEFFNLEEKFCWWENDGPTIGKTSKSDTSLCIVNGIHSRSDFQYIQCDDVFVSKDDYKLLEILEEDDIDNIVLDRRKLCCEDDIMTGILRFNTKKCTIAIVVDGKLKKRVKGKPSNLIGESRQKNFAVEQLDMNPNNINQIKVITPSSIPTANLIADKILIITTVPINSELHINCLQQ